MSVAHASHHSTLSEAANNHRQATHHYAYHDNHIPYALTYRVHYQSLFPCTLLMNSFLFSTWTLSLPISMAERREYTHACVQMTAISSRGVKYKIIWELLIVGRNAVMLLTVESNNAVFFSRENVREQIQKASCVMMHFTVCEDDSDLPFLQYSMFFRSSDLYPSPQKSE